MLKKKKKKSNWNVSNYFLFFINLIQVPRLKFVCLFVYLFYFSFSVTESDRLRFENGVENGRRFPWWLFADLIPVQVKTILLHKSFLVPNSKYVHWLADILAQLQKQKQQQQSRERERERTRRRLFGIREFHAHFAPHTRIAKLNINLQGAFEIGYVRNVKALLQFQLMGAKRRSKRAHKDNKNTAQRLTILRKNSKNLSVFHCSCFVTGNLLAILCFMSFTHRK